VIGKDEELDWKKDSSWERKDEVKYQTFLRKEQRQALHKLNTTYGLNTKENKE